MEDFWKYKEIEVELMLWSISQGTWNGVAPTINVYETQLSRRDV